MNTIAFFGDPHGDFSPVRRLVKSAPPRHALFLGDFDLERPLDEELRDLTQSGAEVHFIHGNHDADREEWHDYVFHSSLTSQNIASRVVSIDGIRIAGLGGVFHADIWHPRDGTGDPKFTSRTDYLDLNRRKAWRNGLPLRHRSTIFPEDFNALAGLEADILISHEAPSCHRYGHFEIDDLAEVLGAKVIFHGHQHEDYRATLPNGIKVIGLAKAAVLMTTVEELLNGGCA
ncbi:metallophosphoesterase (plasmid) [Rhizobium sp. CB3171]|uniref:metallophosphoesterase family protein n=1 Tax=Rhizobium sp. CB3171 TaxID=3039157 RepID=UPI0024B0D398|nr:metallophosphoesterase [Rhizobium sp. CB3171]WFU04563.1 metallophosphoesterase [Rhizobium sp. CB3171]